VELHRLLQGTSNFEFERSKRVILHYLPRRPATILDVGGGPGRYSFWLSEMGHSVHLVDVLPLHVQQAWQFQKKAGKQLASIAVGDARSLDFEDNFADVVLLFGPLYHLVRRKERLEALAEARRVLKPGGLLFAAAISRFTSALDGCLRGFIRDPVFMKIIRRDLRSGQHSNPTNNPAYFTTAFFHHPEELEAEIREARFKSVKVHAVTGFAWLLPRFDQTWRNPRLRARLMSILDQTELEPSMLGVSDHLLAVGKK
jgi:ubiquinone/menaquinone biosynthesis C-methylase UbiE